MKADCDWIIDPNETTDLRVFKTEKQILELFKPNIWNVWKEGNMEIEMEVEFEKFLISVGEYINERIDKISTFRFYTILEYITEKNAKNG